MNESLIRGHVEVALGKAYSDAEFIHRRCVFPVIKKRQFVEMLKWNLNVSTPLRQSLLFRDGGRVYRPPSFIQYYYRGLSSSPLKSL